MSRGSKWQDLMENRDPEAEKKLLENFAELTKKGGESLERQYHESFKQKYKVEKPSNLAAAIEIVRAAGYTVSKH